MTVDVSVIISTLNRDYVLPLAIESLLVQDLDATRYEVIVVDNGSTDRTREVVAAYPTVSYIYFDEEKGLSAARNKGLEYAQGRYVGFFDDDSQAPPDWLSTLLALAARHQADIITGPYATFYLHPKPVWFKDDYASYIPYDDERFLPIGHRVSGSNVFIRRALMVGAGGFDTSLGMRGDQLGYGEDTVISSQLHTYDSTVTMFYSPRLMIRHLVKPDLWRWGWLVKQRFKGGRYNYLIKPDRIADTLPKTLMLVAKMLYRAVIKVHLRDREQFPYRQNYLYEQVLLYVHHLGRYYQHLVKRHPAGIA